MSSLDAILEPVMSSSDADPRQTLALVCAKIAPLWPLENFVAVNPYHHFVDHPIEGVADRMAKVAGARTAMPIAYYLAALEQGRFTREDLSTALAAHPARARTGVEAFLKEMRQLSQFDTQPTPVPTVADVASLLCGQDWNWLSIDRISSWAACYFDAGQLMWSSIDKAHSVYASWREEAGWDRTPEVFGLTGFRRAIEALPREPLETARLALERLGIPNAARELYLHRLLMRVGGWSAYAARLVWEDALQQRPNDTLIEFLCVLLGWELAIYETTAHRGIKKPWQIAVEQLTRMTVEPVLDRTDTDTLILQEALDRGAQRRVVEAFNGRSASAAKPAARPAAQAAFCIDVRSEVFRRHLEACAPQIETIGFAGFFAFFVNYVPVGTETENAQFPVLLTGTHRVCETLPNPADNEKLLAHRRLVKQVRRAWWWFKMGAISCFSFVGPVGLMYLPKLFSDSFGWTRPVPHPQHDAMGQWEHSPRRPVLDPGQHGGHADGMPLADRINAAEFALRAMFLTENFAPFVLIVGHGSTVVNNAHWTGLDCGACGGHTGEANARVAAAVFNDPAVRAGLATRGIVIPQDTVFLACQHDTTTDQIAIYNRADVAAASAAALASLERQLAQAGKLTRAERARRLPGAQAGDIDDAIVWRSKDWAELRPEWGLAGCSVFVVAPREHSAGLDLGGRAFLHSYVWRKDEGFGVLELIMTAPMVVASWISLQYYASTVDNRVFGAGNKTLHNVVGRVGVYEGNGGDLRAGLPWQSVHDGERYQHEPLRLSVVIEAPIDAMNDVLRKHDMVRALCDNAWVQLLAMDDAGRITHRYRRDLTWDPIVIEHADQAHAA
jgi:uncharacterized protein YbcC (UPF0753/DUF2309 family)